jgi:O-antigen/teichoic acid export membrane protein
MSLWLGAEFADQSYPLLQVFAIGVLINGLAQVPATVLQGIGKPHWPAMIHLAELLLYIPTSFFAIRHFGLAGAALAWGGRIAFDALALVWAVRKAWGIQSFVSLRDLLPMLVLTGLLVLHTLLGNQRHPILFALLLLAVFLTFYRQRIVCLAKGIGAQRAGTS